MKKLAQSFNTAAQDLNPGFHSRESEALPLSHCTHFYMLERVQRRGTKMITKLRDISYKMHLRECGLTILETRRTDQTEVFEIHS